MKWFYLFLLRRQRCNNLESKFFLHQSFLLLKLGTPQFLVGQIFVAHVIVKDEGHLLDLDRGHSIRA